MAVYYIGSVPFGQSDIQHFGVKGMKWGVRRFQNEDGSLTALGQKRYGSSGLRDARGRARDLNKLDREQANARTRYEHYNNKANLKLARATKRLKKAEERGNDVKADKQRSKIDEINSGKTVKKAAEYKALLDRSKALTDKIIADSLASGYSVKSRDTIRFVNTGRNAAVNLLAAGVGTAISVGTGGMVRVGYAQSQWAPGTKYKVKNDGLGYREDRTQHTAKRRRR